MNNLSFIYLMGPAPEGQNPLISFLPIILVFVVFYFFLIRPQVRKQKEMTNYRNTLKKGDKVITTGGIYAKITDVKETTVTIDAGEGILLKVDKSAVLRDSSDLQQQK